MCKQLLILLMSLSVFSRSWANEVLIDGINYEVDNSTMTATVIYASPETYTGSVIIPSTVSQTYGTLTVTGISNGAFSDCTGLTEVTIPATVTYIGSSAFKGCTSLKSAKLSDNITSIGDYAFSDCTSLQDINCPTSLTYIQEGTFFGCVSLNAFVIAPSVTYINDRAFEKCIELKELTIADGTDVLTSNNAFEELPLKSLYLGRPLERYSFNLTDLETLSIGSTIETIPGFCAGARNLSSLTIAEGVKNIDDQAFSNCTSLQTLSLPASVISIGFGAFQYCSALTSVNLNKTIEFEGGVFSGCKSLKSIELPEGMTTIPYYFLSDCESLESITIPSTVTSIGDAAFRRCPLTSVDIPDGVTSIGEEAFQGCPLTSVDIPDGVTHIKYGAFSECKSIEHLTFGPNVRYIEDAAFRECRKISELCYRGTLADWLKICFGSDSRPYPEDTNPLSYTETFKIYDAANDNYIPVTDIVIPEGTDSIPALALCGCKGFTSLEMPQTVEYIGADAFSRSGLKNAVVRAKSIHEFAFCYTRLGEVTLGANLEEVKNYAFSNCPISTIRFEGNMDKWCAINWKSKPSCTDLYIDGTLQVNVTIPETVEEIKDYCFSGCYGIESASISSSTKKIGVDSFSQCTNLKSLVWGSTSPKNNKLAANATADGFEIGLNAFYNDTNLSDIILPENITSIGFEAFKNTAWMENLPDGPAYIGNILYVYKGTIPNNSHIVIREGTIGICSYAFNDYSEGGFSVALPYSLSTLADGVFSGNSGLTGISLPEGLTSIGNQTFYNCLALKEIRLPNSLKSIGSSAFYNSGITSVTVPASVTSIYSSTFSGCNDLRSLSLADGADSLYIIGNEFGYGSHIESIYIGRNAKAIKNDQDMEARTLYIGNRHLKELTIGSRIANMGKLSFENCENGLTDITILRDIPPVYDDIWNTFPYEAYQNATLHIPAGSESAYAKAAVWEKFLNIIGEDLTGINQVTTDSKYSTTEQHYDLSGRLAKPGTPGFHIVRRQDGSSYKQLIK